MTGLLRPLILAAIVLCLGAGSALAQGRSGKAEPPGKGYGVKKQIEEGIGQPTDQAERARQILREQGEELERSMQREHAPGEDADADTEPAEVDDASEQLERSERKEKSSAAREKLTKEERAELKAEEGPGFWGRMRRFFGWERSQERMSEQGREHQRASEQERGPKDR